MNGIFNINGKKKTLQFNSKERLLISLRNNGYKEVKDGCLEGECGACLIILDGRPVHSCQVFTASAQNKKILTIKGIGDLHEPHELQKAFAETGAVQCGFCTPGFIIASYCLIRENPNPSEHDIKNALSGNLCRCTGYVKIIEAVKIAAKRIRKSRKDQRNIL